jgi:hypothetical protein
MHIQLTQRHIHQIAQPSWLGGIYDSVFWEVELIDSPDCLSELQRPDNWHDHGISAIGHQRKQCSSRWGASATLTELLALPGKQRAEFLCAAAQADTDTGRNYFRRLWYRDTDYYVNATVTETVINYDAPGLKMDPHCDNNHIMLQTIINLTDNDSGTELFDITSPEPYYRMTGQRNKGIMFLNSAGALHSIRNINKDRYTLYSAIMIG